jgi:hypothetical protein
MEKEHIMRDKIIAGSIFSCLVLGALYIQKRVFLSKAKAKEEFEEQLPKPEPSTPAVPTDA